MSVMCYHDLSVICTMSVYSVGVYVNERKVRKTSDCALKLLRKLSLDISTLNFLVCHLVFWNQTQIFFQKGLSLSFSKGLSHVSCIE